MTAKVRKTSSSKPGRRPPEQIDPALRETLRRNIEKGELPCAVAFRIAAELRKPPEEIGAAADLLDIRLVKCQMGLFGYSPEKKTVKAASAVEPELEDAIRKNLENGKLPCRTAWSIAEAVKMPRLGVSAACEALGIKIKPCQLGAF